MPVKRGKEGGHGLRGSGNGARGRLCTRIAYYWRMAALHHPDIDDIELVYVLAALGHPARLQIARALADGVERYCGEIMPDVPKSSMTHHWRALRESGVIRQRRAGRKLYLTLRRDELDALFPGLLDIVLTEPVGTR
ncbi:transcriptional regulator [Embleya hyalina]|nr:transcriptional regulator [Embleya hyalina]